MLQAVVKNYSFFTLPNKNIEQKMKGVKNSMLKHVI